MHENTISEYRGIIAGCKALFLQKNADYGTSWRVLRLPSLTDQILIKAQRIRSIQEKGQQRVSDDISDDFRGVINYCMMALMVNHLPTAAEQVSDRELDEAYQAQADHTLELLQAKNHDYDEAWRHMRISSITDIILMKLLRIKQIEDNEGATQVSEGVESGYRDIINYAVFVLIKLKTEEK